MIKGRDESSMTHHRSPEGEDIDGFFVYYSSKFTQDGAIRQEYVLRMKKKKNNATADAQMNDVSEKFISE